jgi:hypothetical protein
MNKDTINVTIEIPKRLFNLVASMAENANEEFKTKLNAKDLITRWIIQYFGTKNSLDIMAYSAERFKEPLKDLSLPIKEVFDSFQQTALKFDEVSDKTNVLFKQVVAILNTIPVEEAENAE